LARNIMPSEVVWGACRLRSSHPLDDVILVVMLVFLKFSDTMSQGQMTCCAIDKKKRAWGKKNRSFVEPATSIWTFCSCSETLKVVNRSLPIRFQEDFLISSERTVKRYSFHSFWSVSV
jgi:hypothetical protein